MKNQFFKDLFVVGPLWFVSRLAGAIFFIMIFYKIGPEAIWSMDTGGTPALVLAPSLLVIFSVLAAAVSLLTDFGLMEYVGTLARPLMQPLFKLPGRSAIDCLASWLGSNSVGVVITTRLHDAGYYSDREASIIATSFSVISVAYIYVMADFVGLPHMYFQILIAIYIVSLILAILAPRIWPLKNIPDTYSGRSGQQIPEREIPAGYSLSEWALASAVERAKKEGINTIIKTCYQTFLFLSLAPCRLSCLGVPLCSSLQLILPYFSGFLCPLSGCWSWSEFPKLSKWRLPLCLPLPINFGCSYWSDLYHCCWQIYVCLHICNRIIYMTEIGVLILNSLYL